MTQCRVAREREWKECSEKREESTRWGRSELEEGEARWAVVIEGAFDPIPVSRRQLAAVKQLVKG